MLLLLLPAFFMFYKGRGRGKEAITGEYIGSSSSSRRPYIRDVTYVFTELGHSEKSENVTLKLLLRQWVFPCEAAQ